MFGQNWMLGNMTKVMLIQKKRGKTEALRSLLLRLNLFRLFCIIHVFFFFFFFFTTPIVVVVVVVVVVFRAERVSYPKLSDATQALYTPAIKRYKLMFNNQFKHH